MLLYAVLQALCICSLETLSTTGLTSCHIGSVNKDAERVNAMFLPSLTLATACKQEA